MWCWSALSLFVFETDDLPCSPRSSCYSASFISYRSDRRPCTACLLFVCLRVGVRCVCVCRLLVIAHGTVTSSIFVQVCVRTRGEVWCCVGAQGFCSMLSWEMKSGKCSGVKTLPHWIQCRGDTQTPTAKWCRSSLWLQAVESCRDAHIPRIDTHTDTLGAADRSSAEVKSCHK